jgi:hypothetical protein
LERAEEQFGAVHAQELMAVLSDAEAVDSALELIDLYSPNAEIIGGAIVLKIGVSYRLRLVPIGTSIARGQQVAFDWSTVRRLKIMDLSPC